MGCQKLLALAIASTIVSAACAAVEPKPPTPPRALTINTKIHTFALRNGMRVLVLEDRTTDLVYVGARYSVGAIEDPEGKHGLAHLAEHVAFLPRISGKRLDSVLGEASLVSNASTIWDYTHYYAIARDSKLEELLSVESMRLQPGVCQTVSAEDFEREREIVLNELRYRNGHDGGDMLRTNLASAYPDGHPYRRLVGGDETQVASITKADVCQFIDRYYVPAQVTLVISGNVSKAQAQKVLGKTVSQVPGRKPAPRVAPVAAPVPRGLRTVKKAVDAPMLYVTWALPPMMTKARAAAEMAMDLIASKLWQWNATNEFARSISFQVFGGEYAPVAVLSLQLSKADKLGEARSWIGKAVKRFDEGRDDDSFVSSKQYAMTAMVRRLDSIRGRADRLADYIQLADGSRGYFIEEFRRLDKLQRSSVQSVGREYFATAKSSLLMVVPDQGARQKYQAVPLTYAGSGHDSTARRVPVDPAEAHKPLQVPLSRSQLHRARRFQLDNGMQVALLPSSSVPLVDMRLIFAGGTSAEPAKKAGLARAAAQLLRPNLQSVTAREQLDTLIKFYKVGGSVRTSAGDDYTEFRVVGMESYFDILIAGLERTIKAGSYQREAVEGYRSSTKAMLGGRDRASGLLRARALYRAVYGAGHPYADKGFVTPASVGRINLDALQSYRSRYFVASNAILVITGKFDPDLMEKHVRYRFGHWGSGARAELALPAPSASGKRFKVESGPRPTVSIDIAWPVENARESVVAWQILQQILSSRVSALREEMGVSYGISASLSVNRGPGMMRISGLVDRRRAGEALRRLLQVIESLRKGEDSFDADFVLARRQVAGIYATSTNSAAETSSRLRIALLHGLGIDYTTARIAKVAGMKPDAIKKLLEHKLLPRRQSIILHGPRGDVDKAFETAGVKGATWFE